jgi:hypothetical protein
MKNIIYSRKNIIFLLIILNIFILFGCNFFYKNREEDKNDAEKVTIEFYNFLQHDKYELTYKFFSPELLEVTDSTKLKLTFESLKSKLGAIKSYKLTDWETLRIEGTNPKSEYVLVYEIERELYNSKERISLVKVDGEIKIIGFNVDSDGFLMLEN